MKVVILAGGLGTRISEYSNNIPKPMVPIGDRPILWHIMKIYAKYGYIDFNLALGYKAEMIKSYFLNYSSLNSDFTVNLETGDFAIHQKDNVNWKVTLIDTGLNTMTGGRVKRMQDYVDNKTFLLTYGDGVSDINIKDLIDFHKSHGKMVTVTAVHPGARFGELDIVNKSVRTFKEKPQTTQGWINGGYFVIEPEFIDLIEGDDSILEKDPLERASELGQLMAFQHDGFWQCMDTRRDRDFLEKIWNSGNAVWSK